ncbi:hypothetical protein PoB_003463600 [Plakobranchus ocellatus]|uniref:Uncharacterized protein n=1 Tax=Plakobranchus ocellatus TaxID=259542 RepID=A0AAV4ANG2_9GAST|nr:hypothetical protein PoB_003463600 [Plakobranchus ocellatus]
MELFEINMNVSTLWKSRGGIGGVGGNVKHEEEEEEEEEMEVEKEKVKVEERRKRRDGAGGGEEEEIKEKQDEETEREAFRLPSSQRLSNGLKLELELEPATENSCSSQAKIANHFATRIAKTNLRSTVKPGTLR